MRNSNRTKYYQKESHENLLVDVDSEDGQIRIEDDDDQIIMGVESLQTRNFSQNRFRNNQNK